MKPTKFGVVQSLWKIKLVKFCFQEHNLFVLYFARNFQDLSLKTLELQVLLSCPLFLFGFDWEHFELKIPLQSLSLKTGVINKQRGSWPGESGQMHSVFDHHKCRQ